MKLSSRIGKSVNFGICFNITKLFLPAGGARSFDRSLSDRGNWFERSNSTSGGQPGEEGGPPNGSISPRKSYSRAPYDDWRKPASATSGGDQDEEGQGGGGGWRSGPSSSGRRWNAPPGSDGGRGINIFQNNLKCIDFT